MNFSTQTSTSKTLGSTAIGSAVYLIFFLPLIPKL